MLDVGDGHSLYWETCGNPAGKPALVLHGGPGSGCSEGMRRLFDPQRYRIVLFDQRNAGRSTPPASDPVVALAYAQAHPERVSELVLAAVTNGDRRETDWITRDMGRVFPREWERFRDGVPAAERDGDLSAAYSRLLHDPDAA